MSRTRRAAIALVTATALSAIAWSGVLAGPGHSGRHGHETLEQMRELHRRHTHEHDFKAMEKMSPEQADRIVGLMREIGLALPPMNSRRGRELFMEKGCVVCHAVNGVGGTVGPSLNAADMPVPMNAFEFAARMLKGAQAMTMMQEEELGGIIQLSGQELADLVAFAHDERAQKSVSLRQVPERWRKKLDQFR
jgi:cytochrome c